MRNVTGPFVCDSSGARVLLFACVRLRSAKHRESRPGVRVVHSIQLRALSIVDASHRQGARCALGQTSAVTVLVWR